MALHTLNRAPGDLLCFQRCLESLSTGDALLLIEDGVYAALEACEHHYLQLPAEVDLYALQADLAARGIGDSLNKAFKIVDDSGFVSLACTHDKVISWF